MLPLFRTVVPLCLLVLAAGNPDKSEDVKHLPQAVDTLAINDAEESEPQARAERCTTCSGGLLKGGLSHKQVLAAIQALPGAEVHSSSSFQGCSTEKGCAGIKVKDGAVIEKYGNIDSFKAAQAANQGNEFSFHSSPSGFGNGVLEGGIPKEGPFWWMNENSPFKNSGANYEKFSQSSSSSFNSGGAGSNTGGNGGGSGQFSATLDLSGNPFLNGDISKLASGFVAGAGQSSGAAGSGSYNGGQAGLDLSNNPYLNSQGQGGLQSSSFESSSSFSSSSKDNGNIDLSKNPFLNGAGFSNKFGAGQAGLSGQAGQGNLGGGQVSENKYSSSSSTFSSGQNGGQFGSSSGNGGQFGAGAQFGSGSVNRPGYGTATTGTSGSGSQYGSSSTSSSGSTGEFGTASPGASGNNGQFGSSTGGAQFGLQAGFQGNQGGTFQGAQTPGSYGSSSSSNRFSSTSSQSGQGGYTGSSPSPFIASTAGSNSKNEFDFNQQQQTQQNIDEIYSQGAANHKEHSIAGLQQTCAGQGYICVQKAQCNNGVVNTNGAGILMARTKKQYCNTNTEICCRIEITNIPGASGNVQGSLGVGSATFSGSTGLEGSSIFSSGSSNTASGTAGFGSNSFGANSQKGSNTFGSNAFGSDSQKGSNAFGSNAFGSNSQKGSNAFGSNSFGANSQKGTNGFGSTTGSSTNGFGSSSNTYGSSANTFGAGSNSVGSNGNGFAAGANKNFGAAGTYESSSSSFESSSRGSTLGGSGNNLASNNAQGNFGVTGSGLNTFGTTGSGNQAANGYGSTSFSKESSSSSYNSNGGRTGGGLIHIPPATGGVGVVFKGATNTQTNTIESAADSFTAGSESAGVYRPGAGPGQKPGIPYLPPVDASISSSNTISSTYRPPSPSTPRPYTPRPTTNAPTYLPPQGEQSINRPTFVPGPRGPEDIEGSLYLDQTREPTRQQIQPTINDIPAGCAAALKCTPIEFCTAEGVISNSTVILTKDQDAFRVPLTDCRDLESGRVGKCCRDPTYTDPWPTNQLGKWVPGVFGGDDGAYKPDNRGTPNTPSKVGTGKIILNEFRTTPRPVTPSYGSTQQTGQSQVQFVTQQQAGQGQTTVQGQGSFGQFGQGQYEKRGQGQIVSQGVGQTVIQGQGGFGQAGQGQFGQASQGQFGQASKGQFGQASQGQFGQAGQTQFGQDQFTQQSTVTQQGQFGQRGQGQIVSQGQGQLVSQGQGQLVSQGQGQIVSQGQGQIVSQGQGQYVGQGQGQLVNQGAGGFGQYENAYGESVQRVFLSQYNAGGQCGIFNGQKPFGNRNELEVDFGEIPWQAMVLLQTNKSLLCGGVITRPDVVLTSAACVEGLQAKNVLIKGGEWKLGIDDEPLPFQIVQVKNILRHPGYKSGSLINDVAILVLTENLRLAKNIYPICLPGARETLDGFYNGAGECIVTGWGKQVLQAHLSGSIMHSLNVSLINPGECQAKLSEDYPHLLEQYDQDSCACGVPTNPINNICKVDIGSALACTTGDGHFVLRGVYSWDSGCQPGNQLAAFFKFDLEWYEWALGLSEGSGLYTSRYGGTATVQSQQNSFSSQFNSGIKGGQINAGIKGGLFNAGIKGGLFNAGIKSGQLQSGQVSNQQSQFSTSSKFTDASGFKGASSGENLGLGISSQTKPINGGSYSASFSSAQKQFYQTKPQIVTYTTKPEIVTYTTKPEIYTYTTKPEIFTYTTKPKIVTYTTKPQIIRYETSGSGQSPQYAAPGVTFNPSFAGLVGKQHTHGSQCKCLENGKK